MRGEVVVVFGGCHNEGGVGCGDDGGMTRMVVRGVGKGGDGSGGDAGWMMMVARKGEWYGGSNRLGDGDRFWVHRKRSPEKFSGGGGWWPAAMAGGQRRRLVAGGGRLVAGGSWGGGRRVAGI
nr:hypothetical protein [Tanacetum cinerariifolium]